MDGEIYFTLKQKKINKNEKSGLILFLGQTAEIFCHCHLYTMKMQDRAGGKLSHDYWSGCNKSGKLLFERGSIVYIYKKDFVQSWKYE